MIKYVAAFLMCLVWAISVAANEPGWTDQERLQQRDMVCLGSVITVEKVGQIDTNRFLQLAVVKISGIKKGEKTAAGSRINVYYEFCSSGLNTRCPRYAELAKGDKGTFYLRNLTDEIKKALKIEAFKEPAFFLGMGSDVKKETTEQTFGDGKPASQP
jgi:hypothetical protein